MSSMFWPQHHWTHFGSLTLGARQSIRNGPSGLDAAVAAEVQAEIGRRSNVSISAIARAQDMRQATLSSRVNGNIPSPSSLSAVAKLLGTTASEITARAER